MEQSLHPSRNPHRVVNIRKPCARRTRHLGRHLAGRHANERNCATTKSPRVIPVDVLWGYRGRVLWLGAEERGGGSVARSYWFPRLGPRLGGRRDEKRGVREQASVRLARPLSTVASPRRIGWREREREDSRNTFSKLPRDSVTGVEVIESSLDSGTRLRVATLFQYNSSKIFHWIEYRELFCSLLAENRKIFME